MSILPEPKNNVEDVFIIENPKIVTEMAGPGHGVVLMATLYGLHNHLAFADSKSNAINHIMEPRSELAKMDMSEYKTERSRGEEMNVARQLEEMQKQINELSRKHPTQVRTNETTTYGTLAPRKANDEGNEIRIQRKIPIEVKKRIIAKHEQKMRIKDIASHYKMPQSTISTIIKNKEAIKSTKIKETDKSRELPPKATTSEPSPSTSSSHGIKRPAAPRKANDEGNEIRIQRKIPIEVKKRIIAKHEQNMRIKDIASHYNMPRSTISTIIKNKEAIKSTKSKETDKSRELPPKATASEPSPSTSSSHGIKRPASEKLDFTQQQPEIFKKRNTFSMKEKQDLFYLVLEGFDWKAARNKMILWEHEPRTAEEYKNRVKYQFKK